MLYQTENPHGGDIYKEKTVLDFSSNTNPFGTPQEVVEAICSAASRVYQYPDPYCRELLSAIAEYESVPKEYILCGNGAAELIYAYCRARAPQSAIEPAPTFLEYTFALKSIGAHISRHFLSQDKNFDLDDGFLAFAEKRKPEAVFLCNPNNPSGRLISSHILSSILDFCHSRKIALFVDECFLDLSDGGISIKEALSSYPELFILKAFTKSYGMAGLRLGYCLSSHKDLLKRMSQTLQPWNVSLIAQAAGITALRQTDFILKTKELIVTERRWLKERLEMLGCWVCPSSANYLLFKTIPNLDAVLKKSGIAIRNCDNYYGLSSGWYRIAVKLHTQNEQLIAGMSAALKKE